jgi:hypothetical protein
VSNLSDVVYIAVATTGNLGGFEPGDIFTGNGRPGQVLRITDGGSTVDNPWITLPGETGLLRGDLVFDHTGLFGGDLIIATSAGGIWRVNAQGTPTHVADVPGFVEGIAIIPDDPTRYGDLAGKILAAAVSSEGVYTISPSGQTHYYDLGIDELERPVLVAAGENFFGVDQSATVYAAPASEFGSLDGDILLASEYASDLGGGRTSSGLYRLRWDGSAPVVEPIVLSAMSAAPKHWEGIIFALAALGPIPESRQGLPDWTIYLDANDNGQLDASEVTTTTDPDGNHVSRCDLRRRWSRWDRDTGGRCHRRRERDRPSSGHHERQAPEIDPDRSDVCLPDHRQ